MIESVSSKVISASISLAEEFLRKSIDKFSTERHEAIAKEHQNQRAQDEIMFALRQEPITYSFNIDQDNTINEIVRHQKIVQRWSSEIDFRDLQRAKKVSEIYVNLDVYLIPRHIQIDESEGGNLEPLFTAVNGSEKNILFLGHPGAGKTTTMKKITSSLLRGDEAFSKHPFVILLRLRELDESYIGEDHLTNAICDIISCKLNIKWPSTLEQEAHNFEKYLCDIRIKSVWRYLDQLSPLIVLDGYDEIANPAVKSSVLREIRVISKECFDLRIFVTSRTGEISVPPEHFDEFEISSLKWKQIEEFANKWLPSPRQSSTFLKDIRNSLFYDASMRPLSLAHLCAIYQRTGRIPEQPKSIYKKIVRLLLEEWDEQRGIRRSTKYSNFDIDRKFEFLSNLAYHFSVKLNRYVVTESDFFDAYIHLSKRFRLDSAEVVEITKEIESHTGLLIRSGQDSFEFAHKSLQEYLAAEHIVRLPRPPNSYGELKNLSSELAVAVSISSGPSAFLADLVGNSFFNNGLPGSFFMSFLGRLCGEAPDFEDPEMAFWAILMIISLSTTNGKAEAPSKKQKQILGGTGKINIPVVEGLFDPDEWRSMIESAKKEFRQISSKDTKAKPIEYMTSARIRLRYPHVYRNFFLPPASRLDRAAILDIYQG